MKKEIVTELCQHRDEILSHLECIKNILQQTDGCEKEYYLANSHYIPQIITALQNHAKFLPRGVYNLQNTIDNLSDELSSNESNMGMKKYIF